MASNLVRSSVNTISRLLLDIGLLNLYFFVSSAFLKIINLILNALLPMDVVILVLIYLIDKIINALEIKLSTLAPHLIISLILVSLRNVYAMKTITLKSNRMSICTEDSHKPTNHYGSPLQCNTTIKKSQLKKKFPSQKKFLVSFTENL